MNVHLKEVKALIKKGLPINAADMGTALVAASGYYANLGLVYLYSLVINLKM